MRDGLPEFELDGFLPYRVTVVAQRLSVSLARHYKERYGISVAEWRVLVHVGYGEDLSIKDLETFVSLEKSKASRAASRLEAKGLLIKRPHAQDKRLLQLELTPAGLELLRELVPIAQSFQAELEAALGGRRQALTDTLDILMDSTK